MTALRERLNPILVKEVRQALRGRFFKIIFWLTLLVATFSGLFVVAGGATLTRGEEIGQFFFMVMFACLSAAVHAFTPFWAYLSTSSEWDENTHDLLVLSNLRPRQIVSGKLLSALVQALLYYSTFGPFLVFAFLLNGIDLLSIAVILVSSLATCLALTVVGIALASLARVRAVRGMLMAVFGAALTMAWGAGLGMVGAIVSSPGDLRSDEGQLALCVYLTVMLIVGLLFGAIATARFAHEEENRSSGLRVLSFVLVLLAGVWGAWLIAQFREPEVAWFTQVVAVCACLLLWTFFLTEPDPLGRRAAKLVPANRALALLSIPFQPGGGRGVLLFLLQGACALIGARVALLFMPATASAVREAWGEVLVLYAYAFVFLALPAVLAGRFVKTAAGRGVTRVVILLALPLVILLPGLLGLLLGVESWMKLEHALNPVWVMDGMFRDGSELAPILVLLLLAALLTLLVNAPRTVDGVREVLRASAARRARER